jgi:hypothetical protein
MQEGNKRARKGEGQRAREKTEEKPSKRRKMIISCY